MDCRFDCHIFRAEFVAVVIGIVYGPLFELGRREGREGARKRERCGENDIGMDTKDSYV